jgi:hypothetical protein
MEPEKIVRELSNWIWNGPTKTHNQLDEKIAAALRQTREEALEEFMREADKMLGPSDQSDRLAKRIRALASGSEEGK